MARRLIETERPEQSEGTLRVGDARARMAGRLATRSLELVVLQRICELGFGAASLEDALGAIAEEISSWSGFPIVAVELFDEHERRVVPATAIGVPADVELPLSGSVALTGQRLVERDVLERPERASPALLRAGARTVLSLPLGSEGEIGALVLADREVLDVPDTLADLMESIAHHVGELIECTRAEQEQEKYQRLVEQLPLVTYIDRLDEWSSSLYVSPQIEPLLGYPVDEWLSNRELFREVLHPDDRESVLMALRDRPARFSAEYRMIAKDGRVIWVQDEARQELDVRGNPGTLHGYLVDITERKALEERLREATKLEAIGRLAGGVAHEFNNLNAIVAGYAELLATDVGSDSPLSPHVSAIQAAAARSAELIEQLLAFSQRRRMEPSPFDLNEIVRSVEALLAGVVGDEITRELVLDPDPLVVTVDAGQIQEVVLALAENARQAMHEGGTLTVETSRGTSFACLAVADTGVGIDEQTQRLIFDPFFTTREIGEGAGLGLASVRGAVEASGGSIEVESKRGLGTTFRIRLPLA